MGNEEGAIKGSQQTSILKEFLILTARDAMSLGVHDLLYALGLTASISLSGVMMPGPVFAAVVAKGVEDKLAGVWIAVGHGVVEFPLMAIIFLGFAQLVDNPFLTMVVGIAGGALLIYLGASMIMKRRGEMETEALPHHPLLLGMITTASNPYFLIWWVTIGLWLILMVHPFALVGFVAFALVHWSCDLGWNGVVSATVHRTKRFWTRRFRQVVFAVVGGFLGALGVWFVYMAPTKGLRIT